MRGPAIHAAIALVGVAPLVQAQTQSFTSGAVVNVERRWRNNTTGAQTALSPGDSATISFNVSFTNQGSLATFSPAIGKFMQGTILGIGSGFFDLNGCDGTEGIFVISSRVGTNNGTTGIGVRTGWRIVGNASERSVNAAGTGVTQIQFGQFPTSPGLANTMNPVNRMFAMNWTPGSYAGRAFTFSLAGYPGAGQAMASVYMDLNGSVGASAFVTAGNLKLFSISIPIVPAPASLALLGLGSWVAGCRRR